MCQAIFPPMCTSHGWESLGLECKCVLVLDNCSAHPEASDLVSDDGKIIAKFLPPNVTSLIQPMDQGVIEALKRRYKKKLLRGVIIADDRGDSLLDYIKSVNMSTVVQLVTESWDEIEPSTLRKSWQKILPLPSKKDTESPDDLVSGFQYNTMGRHR